MALEHLRTYIVLVNRNGWKDTVECLESLFRLDYSNYRVIVCDNASEDDSVARIHAWAGGLFSVQSSSPVLSKLIYPPVQKPIACVIHRAGMTDSTSGSLDASNLIVIRNQANFGFAGGCNAGIRFALAQDDAAFVWLLNNDTVCEPRSLIAMVERMRKCRSAGICGSRVLYYHEPSTVQVLGGASFDERNGETSLVGHGTPTCVSVDIERVEKEIDCVYGASMLVSRQYLEEVGLLDESYFLYYEEVDWALRGRSRFKFVYADDSIVYHKEGSSIGSGSRMKKQSSVASYYSARNRLLILSKHFPAALPRAYFSVAKSAVGRLLRCQPRNAWIILKVLFEGLRSFRSQGSSPSAQYS